MPATINPASRLIAGRPYFRTGEAIAELFHEERKGGVLPAHLTRNQHDHWNQLEEPVDGEQARVGAGDASD